MNGPLATLQLPPDGTGGSTAAGNNISLKQQDAGLNGEFGPLLDEAHAAQPLQPVSGLEPAVDAENLALQLESLPHGGKLLPLLRQVLDSAERAGTDTQQLVDRIAARLEQLRDAGEMNPADDIAVVLHQLLVAVPDSETVAAPQAAMLAAADGKALKQDGVAAGQADRSQLPHLDGRPTVTDAGEKILPEEVRAEVKNTGLDRALAQVQQQDSGQRDTQLASLIAAFKRHNPDLPKAADTVLRTDAASAGTVATTPAAVQPASSTPAGLPTLTLGAPLNQGGWDQALGERIQWMVSHKLQGAQIKLNPANLGPMEVRIQMQNEQQASIQFSSAHGTVREALEAALPRLREMFDASGVELVDVDVSGQSFAEQQRTAGEGGTAAWHGGTSEQDTGPETVLETPLASFLESGRLDLFA